MIDRDALHFHTLVENTGTLATKMYKLKAIEMDAQHKK